MTAPIVWFDIPERHVAAATRFYEASLRSRLSPEQSVGLTLSIFRTAPAVPAHDFALRWRRATPPRDEFDGGNAHEDRAHVA